MPRPSLLTVGVVLLIGVFGLMAVAATQRARTQRDDETELPDRQPAQPPTVVPDPEPARPVKPAPKPRPSFAIATVRAGRTVALRSSPDGPVIARVPSKSEFGSPTTFAVAATRGQWQGMTSTDLPNGKLGWVKRRRTGDDLKSASTHLSLRIDLSTRRLELRNGRKVMRRATVGIGRPGSSTPTGRFSITDKLSGGAYGPYYGCCILALSGHQVNTPPGWQGGDRLAIHGTSNPGSIGVPSSAGCLHAATEDLRVLMRRVPLGTPVFIRA